VVVAVLDGWLSGFIFKPAWAQNRNMFTDPDMMAAQKRLFAAIAARIGAHPAFYGFDLGNELGVLQIISDPCAPAEADAWNSALLDWCETLAPGKMHVNGVDHNHWFRNVGFTRRALATTGRLTALHTWIGFTGVLGRYGVRSTACTHLTQYAIELAKAYHDDVNRLVWIQEFGGMQEWMEPDYIPEFAELTIRSALTCANLWGLTWWCSHDIAESLRDFAPLEYHLGLLDIHNGVKPVGARIAGLIRTLKADMPAPAARPTALVMPDDLLDSDADRIWLLVEQFMALVDDGLHPAIVLASRAGDADYLARRGITSCMALADPAQTG
jgi:hypothetical protein